MIGRVFATESQANLGEQARCPDRNVLKSEVCNDVHSGRASCCARKSSGAIRSHVTLRARTVMTGAVEVLCGHSTPRSVTLGFLHGMFPAWRHRNSNPKRKKPPG